MVNQIFTIITQVITGFIGSLTEAFNGIMAIVWNAETSAITTFGVLLLIAFGVSIVYFALRKVFSLISLGGGKSSK